MSATEESIDRGLRDKHALDQALGDHYPISGSAMSKCAREVFLKMMAMDAGKPPGELSGRAIRTLEMGNMSEKLLVQARTDDLRTQGKYPSSTVFTQYETWTPLGDLSSQDLGSAYLRGELDKFKSLSVDPEDEHHRLLVRSRCDLVIFDDAHCNMAEIEEYKSINSFALKKIKSDGAAREDHQIQVAFQASGLARIGIHTSKATVIYHDKDTSEVVSMEVDLGTRSPVWELMSRRITAMFAALYSYLAKAPTGSSTEGIRGEFAEQFSKNGNLPWQCNYCEFGPLKGGCLTHRDDLRLDYSMGGKHGDVPQWRVEPVI